MIGNALSVAPGGDVCPPSDARQGGELSPRLRETLSHLLEGDGEKQIALRLGLSPCTVHQYVTALYRHFGVGSRAQLMARRLADYVRDGTRELGLEPLSPRLEQTLACLLEGDSEKQVAARLHLSRATTHQYVTALYRHFDVRSRAQLLALVLRRRGAAGLSAALTDAR